MASEQKITKAEARNMTTQLIRQAYEMGVKKSAIDDYVTRAFNALAVTCDAYAVHEWAARERGNADHLFETQERQEPGTPAAPRPQRPGIN
jgi:hypothetical protein